MNDTLLIFPSQSDINLKKREALIKMFDDDASKSDNTPKSEDFHLDQNWSKSRNSMMYAEGGQQEYSAHGWKHHKLQISLKVFDMQHLKY